MPSYAKNIICITRPIAHAQYRPAFSVTILIKRWRTVKKHSVEFLEGFIRQIIGWREFVRIVYEREGGRQRTRNYWAFQKIPNVSGRKREFFLSTGVIKKSSLTATSHHIERLMVIGNFMLLCDLIRSGVPLVLEMYVDAYDWVMCPMSMA